MRSDQRTIARRRSVLALSGPAWRTPTRPRGTTTSPFSTSARARSPRRWRSARRRSPLRAELRGRAPDAGQPLPRAGELQEGGRRIREDVKLEPKDAQAPCNLGVAYVRLARRRRHSRAGDGAGPQARRLRDARRARAGVQAEGRLQARHRAPREGDGAEAGRRRGLEEPGHRPVEDRRQGRRGRRVQEGDRAEARRRRAALRPGDRLPAPAQARQGDHRIRDRGAEEPAAAPRPTTTSACSTRRTRRPPRRRRRSRSTSVRDQPRMRRREGRPGTPEDVQE